MGVFVCVKPMPFEFETIAALATPAGTSALAVLRVSGPLSSGLANVLFGSITTPRMAHHADYRNVGGTLVDDVVFTCFVGPNSYTGEDCLEISCHGNPFVAQMILEDLFARGCRPAEPGEFTKRAFLHGRMDLSRAEAVMDLIHARSERALAAANHQLRGALARELDVLNAILINILAFVEAYIDFPEEDLPPSDRQSLLIQMDSLLARTRSLHATKHYGAILREGIITVIIGEPNVGKSTLLNILAGHERALVSAEPGTTRDYLEEPLLIGPHFLRLVDTAGLNASPSPLERRGIAKSLEQAESADLFLWVLDATQPVPQLSPRLTSLMTQANTIAVFNKIDLNSAESATPPTAFMSGRISAIQGTGLDELKIKIINLVESFRSEQDSDLIAISARHAHLLTSIEISLQLARVRLANEGPDELLACDLRSALRLFGGISGKIIDDEVLEQIFASFCIGK